MNLDTKIPPPIVSLIILTIIYLFDLKEYNLNTDVISVVILFIGIIFIISAVVQFVNRKTTVNPTKPYKTTSLVITGAYKITRNPMYLGLLMIVISTSIFYLNIFSVATPMLFYLWINRFQIKREEIFLTEKFGKEYLLYKTKTRKWI